jgi:hypothetical protein
MMGLLDAWFRRKQWEARLQSITLLNLLGEALGTKRETMSLGALGALGFKVEDTRGIHVG